jgi:hypothetical protein
MIENRLTLTLTYPLSRDRLWEINHILVVLGSLNSDLLTGKCMHTTILNTVSRTMARESTNDILINSLEK